LHIGVPSKVVRPVSSTSSLKERPNPQAIRSVTASVGLASPRSIWLIIERLTPLALPIVLSLQSHQICRFISGLIFGFHCIVHLLEQLIFFPIYC